MSFLFVNKIVTLRVFASLTGYAFFVAQLLKIPLPPLRVEAFFLTKKLSYIHARFALKGTRPNRFALGTPNRTSGSQASRYSLRSSPLASLDGTPLGQPLPLKTSFFDVLPLRSLRSLHVKTFHCHQLVRGYALTLSSMLS